MAINPNELRIGNFVHHNNEWCYRRPEDSNDPAISVNEFDFQWEDRDWYALGECCLSVENMTPILLTEEWLKLADWRGFKYLHINSNFSLDSVGHLYYHGDYTGKNFQYVHQLQNLYFALTETELVFKRAGKI